MANFIFVLVALIIQMSNKQKQERVAFLGRCRVVQVDQGEEIPEFWKYFPPPDTSPVEPEGDPQTPTPQPPAGLEEGDDEQSRRAMTRGVLSSALSAADPITPVGSSAAPPPPPVTPPGPRGRLRRRGSIERRETMERQVQLWDRYISIVSTTSSLFFFLSFYFVAGAIYFLRAHVFSSTLEICWLNKI